MFVGKVSYMLWDLLGAVFALFLSNRYQHHKHALHRIVRILDMYSWC
jgi:hypothetical protein